MEHNGKRIKWSKDKVKEEIMNISTLTKKGIMPSCQEMTAFYGNSALEHAVLRYGSIESFAKELNLQVRESETYFGKKYEKLCSSQIFDLLGLESELTNAKYAYDILVENAVKIDVKAGRKYISKPNTSWYTFNLEKKMQTCDIFVCYCVDDNGETEKVLIIPAIVTSGKSQLSIGKNSKYNKYIDNWELIRNYYNFMLSTI